jgi:shikimate kinase
MNLVLIGYRCTGKTSVGKALAGRLKMPFYDTDEMVQASSGKCVREMVEEKGWPFFRREEKKAISGLAKRDESVIALGGGAVLAEENIRHLKGKGLFIWLKADAETIVKRISGDGKSLGQRPPFSGKDLKEETDSLLATRESIYESVADRTVDTSGRSIERVAEEVERIISEMTKESRSWETR